ncbi:AcrR family transcriptional regulator [Actinophytocola algeriensis]|uniref:AcrR family transcriptional regulator n=1 Tax=Actinophytocola algeriensis TaxID=1768010 RepID=A0A7W7VJR6_9PSEU|nr:AcrR family transcriptional regulator [Actinophytocola algeriensis]MBE1478973.1 AcrR family transcriptional regulator [Actinophytocola algeriensis]
MRSAAELFDRNGFSGATLEDVSRSAGVTKGAFYFHFSSKDELAGAIQAEACGLLRAAVYRVVGSPVPALQGVVNVTHELAWWLTSEPLVRASFRTARECGHRGKPFLDFYGEWLAAIETLLLAAERAGDLRADIDVEEVTTLVLAVSSGLEMVWWTGIRDGDLGDAVTGTWRTLLPGIASESALAAVRAEGAERKSGDVCSSCAPGG